MTSAKTNSVHYQYLSTGEKNVIDRYIIAALESGADVIDCANAINRSQELAFWINTDTLLRRVRKHGLSFVKTRERPQRGHTAGRFSQKEYILIDGAIRQGYESGYSAMHVANLINQMHLSREVSGRYVQVRSDNKMMPLKMREEAR